MKVSICPDIMLIVKISEKDIIKSEYIIDIGGLLK